MAERSIYPTDHSTNTEAEGTNRTGALREKPPSENLTLFYSPQHKLDFFFLHRSVCDSDYKLSTRPIRRNDFFCMLVPPPKEVKSRDTDEQISGIIILSTPPDMEAPSRSKY